MHASTITKVSEVQPVGAYKKTAVDDRKATAHFLLLQTSPNLIRWRKGLCGGKSEIVSNSVLKGLQKIHPNWMTDF